MTSPVQLNKKFLSGNVEVGIEVTPPATDPDVLEAFANNSSFPARQIDLGRISAKAQAGIDHIKFGEGAGQVAFSGSASGFAGLGVYPDPDELLKVLTVDDNIATGLKLGGDPNSLYVALRWGYDVSGSGKGSVALGAPGSITFSGQREAVYAVVRRLPKTTGALTAVQHIAQSWMLPSQINKLEDLEPGTWLFAEADGSVAFSLGVQYGYDFNWVHEAKLAGLSGDIGLRLQMGVSAALSFNASGNFAVVISRDPKDAADKTLGFRLFRLRQKGWGFAFNAGASVKGDFTKFLPEYDEFIKAIFGVHGGQVLKDLNLLRKWTNPEQTLGELLSGPAVKYGEDFLKQVTGIDPETAFNDAKTLFVGFLDKWNDLPNEVSSKIWKLVETKTDLNKILDLARRIEGANLDTVREPIARLLSDVNFFSTPEGAWLEAAAAKGILNALNSTSEFEKLQAVASKTVALLQEDGLKKVLNKLQEYIESHLNLNTLFPGFAKLKDIIGAGSLQDLDQASFATLDTWLKAKLAAFIDKQVDDLNLGDINKIRESIFLFMNKAESFYEKTLKALNNKYEFDFGYSYQSATTKTALLDFTLDFNEPGVIEALRQALAGKYDDLLINKRPGVKLNLGTLTHQIKRQSHVEVNLPWAKSAIDHINQSMAKVDAVDNDGGRLFVYELDSKDLVEEKNKRLSRLAIGGFVEAEANEVRVHSTSELTYAYTFRQVKKEMKRADLQYQLKPYVQTYLRNVFAQGTSGTFDDWIGDLDKQIDAMEFNGTNNFGNALIGLNLSLPAKVSSAWLKAPPKAEHGPKVPAYLNMSRRLQTKLKEILPFYFFQNLENYEKEPLTSQVLLVYSAIPPSTLVRIDDGKLKLDQDDDYYWDYVQPAMRSRMVLAGATRANLSIILERVHNLLLEAGMTGAAEAYAPDQAENMQRIVEKDAKGNGKLWRLLFVENQVVKGARESGYEIAKFMASNQTKPTEAVGALAQFGSKLTSAFNEKIKGDYGGGALRPLGTAMFIEAALVLDPSLATDVTAVLDLIVLKKTSTFEMPSFLAGKNPAKPDVLLQERIINIGS